MENVFVVCRRNLWLVIIGILFINLELCETKLRGWFAFVWFNILEANSIVMLLFSKRK